MVQLSVARHRLAFLWLGASGAFFLLLVVQSVMGHFENRSQEVWSWALPTIMPTLSLIVTVLGADALKSIDSHSTVRKSFLLLAFWLSAFYLALVISTLLIEPLTSMSVLDLVKLSNIWLGPYRRW